MHTTLEFSFLIILGTFILVGMFLSILGVISQ